MKKNYFSKKIKMSTEKEKIILKIKHNMDELLGLEILLDVEFKKHSIMSFYELGLYSDIKTQQLENLNFLILSEIKKLKNFLN